MQVQPFNLKTLMEKSESDRQREQSIYRVTIAGSIINAVLLAFKFTAGILGGSAAMIADARANAGRDVALRGTREGYPHRKKVARAVR